MERSRGCLLNRAIARNSSLRQRVTITRDNTAVAKAPVKENQFDERRETLVMERRTTWDQGVSVPERDKAAIVDALHRNPQGVKKLEYIRTPTGFIRHITVTADDLAVAQGK